MDEDAAASWLCWKYPNACSWQDWGGVLFAEDEATNLGNFTGCFEADMVDIQCVCQENDGVLKQWIEMEADDNGLHAQVMDAVLVDN